MITTHDKRVIKHFQDWVADSSHDKLGESNTPEQWLEMYLDCIGDIIAGSEIPLFCLVEDAKRGTGSF